LFKVAEETTAKLEVMSDIAKDQKADETRNRWCMTTCKECGSTRENDKVNCVHTPYLPIPTDNRYDVLLNLRDYPSSKEDVVIQENKQLRRIRRLRLGITQNIVLGTQEK
jgi:hypothetical protein